MNKTELFIKLNGEWEELELSSDLAFVIEFNIAEIKDIAKRKSSYSKTITIPHTKNNNKVLKGLFDANNVIIKNIDIDTEFVLLRDTVIIMEGIVLINAVKENDNTFVYNAVLKSETNQLIKNIGDKELTDLDLSYLNHDYTGENIVATWTASNAVGYYYPLIDYNFELDSTSLQNDGYVVPEGLGGIYGLLEKLWRPAVYVRNIVDNIITEAGYKYNSDFFENDTTYNNLIIPFSREDMKVSEEFKRNNTLKVGLTFSGSGLTDSNYNFDFTYADQVFTVDDMINIYEPFNDPFTPTTANYNMFEDRFVYTSGWESIQFTDSNNNADYFDIQDKWNTTIYSYQEDSRKDQKFTVNLDFWLNKGAVQDIVTDAWNGGRVWTTGTYTPPDSPYVFYNGLNVPTSNVDAGFQILARVMRYDGFGGASLVPLEGLDGQILQEYPIYQSVAGDDYINDNYIKYFNRDDNIVYGVVDDNIVDTDGDGVRYTCQIKTKRLDGTDYGTTYSNTFLQPGEYLKVELIVKFLGIRDSSILNWEEFNTTTKDFNIMVLNSGLIAPTTYESDLPSSGRTYILNEISNSVIPGNEIEMNNTLPDKIKQKDFLNSVIKMFNLYVDIDPNDNKRLLIEPRDDFFDATQPKDWGDKLDLSKEIHQDLLYTDSKSFLFTHKNDTNETYLNDYTNKYQEIYGQEDYFRLDDSEIKQKTEEVKIETIFGASALKSANNFGAIIYPTYQTDNNKERGKYKGKNLRILQRNPNGLVKIPSNSPNGFIKYPVDMDGNEIPMLTVTQSAQVASTQSNYYPYAGHFDNPYSPTSDINYGQLQSYFYPINRPTINTLYNKYWRNTVEEIANKNSRKITAYFDLDAYDIANFNFKDIIQVNFLSSGGNGLYRVNKIKYSPVGENSSQVELIKIFDYQINQDELENNTNIVSIDNGSGLIGVGIDPSILGVGIRNNVNSHFVFVNGFQNNIGYGNFGLMSNSNTANVGNDNKFASIVSASGSKMGSNNDNVSVMAGVSNSIGSNNNNLNTLGGNNNKISYDNNNSSMIGGVNNKIDTNNDNVSLYLGQSNSIVNMRFGHTSSVYFSVNNSFITGGKNNQLGGYASDVLDSGVIGGINNKIAPVIGTISFTSSSPDYLKKDTYNSYIIGGEDNIIYGTTGSIIFGGTGSTVTQSHTTLIKNNTIKFEYDNVLFNDTPINSIVGITGPTGPQGITGPTGSITSTNLEDLNDVTGTFDDGDTILYDGSNWAAQKLLYVSSNAANSDTFRVNSGTVSPSADFSAILSGFNNTVTGDNSVVVSGDTNEITGGYSAIISGTGNTVATGFIGSGEENEITIEPTLPFPLNSYAFIGSGQENFQRGSGVIVSGYQNSGNQLTFIGQGNNNLIIGDFGGPADAWFSSILNGESNQIQSSIPSARYSTIITGTSGYIGYSDYATIITGNNQEINSSDYGFIAGGENNTVDHNKAFIVGSDITTNRINTTYVNNLSITDISTSVGGVVQWEVWDYKGFLRIGTQSDFTIQDLPGVTGTYNNGDGLVYNGSEWIPYSLERVYTATGTGGVRPTYRTQAGTVSGDNYVALLSGENNDVSGIASVIMGGEGNTIEATSHWSLISGGLNNTIYNNSSSFDSRYSSIVGGRENGASGPNTSIINSAFSNINEGNYTTIVGGFTNYIDNSSNSIMLGGQNNEILNSDDANMLGAASANIGTSSNSILINSGGGSIENSSDSVMLTAGSEISVASEESFIGTGTLNVISGTSSNSAILVSEGSDILNSENSVILNSGLSTIEDSFNSVILNGTGNNIGLNATQSVIMGGGDNTVAHNNSIVLGHDITTTRANTTYVNNLNIKDIPTSSAGLNTGDVWNDGGVLTIV